MSNRDLDMFKKLDSYSSVADFDKLWAGIEPALPTQPTQRRGLVYWPFAVVGLALLLGGFWLYSAQENDLRYSSDVAKAETVAPTRAASEAKHQPEQQAEIVKQLSASGTTESTAATIAHAVKASPNTSWRDQENRDNSRIQAVVADAPSVSVAQVLLPAQPDFNHTSALAEVVLAEQVKPLELSTKQSFTALNRLPLAHAYIKAPFQIPSFQRPDPQTGCYDWSGRKGRIRPYLGVYAGAHLPFRNIESKTREFDAFAASRVATEQKLEAVNAGAFFGLQARNGLSIDGGFEYMRINERFRASDTTVTQVGQVVTIAFIVNAPGDTTFVMDTTDIMQTTINTRTTYNRYSFMSIPLGVGFTFNQKGTLKPYLKGGVQINIGTRQKVGMLDASGQYLLYESSQSTASGYPFRAKVGMMPFIQAGARISLGGALEAFGEVRYLHMQRDVTTDAFALNQRYRTLGAQVGLRLGL